MRENLVSISVGEDNRVEEGICESIAAGGGKEI